MNKEKCQKKNRWVKLFIGMITLCLSIAFWMSKEGAEKQDFAIKKVVKNTKDNQKIVDKNCMGMGQNFLKIGDKLVGSLIRISGDSKYYMGIQDENGNIQPTESRMECSNLILYGNAIYFINDSFPTTIQNVLNHGTDKGRIIKIGYNVEEGTLSEAEMLTGNEELTNQFYIWKSRIYYQVTDMAEEENQDISFHIYSVDIKGKNKEEIYRGVNWTADFVMDGSYIYVAEKPEEITRYDVESKEAISILPREALQKLSYGNCEIEEMVVEENCLLFSTYAAGKRYVYGMQINDDTSSEESIMQKNSWIIKNRQVVGMIYEINSMILPNGKAVAMNPSEYDIKNKTERPREGKILQRDGAELYVYRAGVIYKIPAQQLNSATENAVAVGIKDWKEPEWFVKDDGAHRTIGHNLQNENYWIEGNGCIYTTNQSIYEGKLVEEKNNLYRYKKGIWETFLQLANDETKGKPHEIFEESPLDSDVYIRNIAFYNGYIYYIKGEYNKSYKEVKLEGYICRISEQGGNEEILSRCDGAFNIYEGRIYYKTRGSYWVIEEDGSNRKLIYQEKKAVNYVDLYAYDNENVFRNSYTVGGGCLYLWERGYLLGINLETGAEKYFDIVPEMERIFYEDHYLYILTAQNKIFRQNVINKKMEILYGENGENYISKIEDIWIQDGYIYIIEYSKSGKEFDAKFMFKIIDLETKEIKTYKLAETNSESGDSVHVEVLGEDILIELRRDEGFSQEKKKYKVKLFKQEVDKIWEQGLQEVWTIYEEWNGS